MAHIEKRGPKRWRARYRGPDRKEHSKTFERRSDAERWLGAQAGSVAQGAWTDPRLGRIAFTDLCETYLRTARLRPTTRALNEGVIRNYLLPRFGAWPIASITRSAVKTMISEEEAEGRLSGSAIRRHVFVLSVVMAAAIEESRISRNPCAGVTLPADHAREMRFLNAEELVGLADAIRPEHYRPLVLTAGLVGLRWGELAGLRLERVDLLRRRIAVEEQLVEVGGRASFGPPKTEAGKRTVTIPASLVDVLGEHFAAEAVQRSRLAFPNPSGGFMRRSNFRRTFRRACTLAGFDGGALEGFVFHELRHTAAALAIATGAHPLAIKERLGHSSITVTMDRYGGLLPSLDEAIADGLDSMIRGPLAASLRPAGASIARLSSSGA